MAAPRVVGAWLVLAMCASTAWATDKNTPDAVVVSGSARHLADLSRTGTRSEADPMTLPQSISVIEPEWLERQGARTLVDAVTNVSGVQDPGTSGSLLIRGFGAGIMKNGVLNPTSSNLFAPPLIGISRIEVIKGPEAIIAGQSAGYGGVVNVITKAPQAKRVAEASLQLGERGRYELGADLGGALSEDKRFTGRLVLAEGSEQTDRLGYDGSRRTYIAPSLGFRNPTTGTEATLSYEKNALEQRNFWAVYFNSAQRSLDQSWTPVRLGTNARHVVIADEENLSLHLSQVLTDNWRMSLTLLRNVTKQDLGGGTLGARVVGANVLGIDMAASTRATKDAARLELKGELTTGPLQHRVLLVYDGEHSTFRQEQPASFRTALYQASDGRLLANLGAQGANTVVSDQAPRETGLLAMDQVTWGDRGQWVALAGLRRIGYDPRDRRAAAAETYQATLPMLGVVYRTTPDLSFYASASKGFRANSGLINFVTRKQVEPERAQQHEIGFKQQMRDGQLALTGAWYRIRQDNYASPDVVNSVAPISYYNSVPGVTSEGVEIELSGNLTDRLSLRAAYANGGVNTPSGQTPIPFARQQYGVSLAYSLIGETAGWWLGGGVKGRDPARNRDTTLGRDVISPRSLQWDLSAGHEGRDWSLTAGIKNVTNRVNYTLESGPNGIGIVVQPREFYLSTRFRF